MQFHSNSKRKSKKRGVWRTEARPSCSCAVGQGQPRSSLSTGQRSPCQASSGSTEGSVPDSGGARGLGLGRAAEPTPTHRVLHEPLQLELLLLGRILGDDERLRLFLGPGRSHSGGCRTRHSSFQLPRKRRRRPLVLMTTNGRASCACALPDLDRSPAALAHSLYRGVGGGVESHSPSC